VATEREFFLHAFKCFSVQGEEGKMGNILEKPFNEYSFFYETSDCVLGSNNEGDSSTAVFRFAVYDSFLFQQLFIAILSMIVNIGVVYYHTIHEVHPKYQLRLVRRWCMHIHVISGLTEIIFGFSYWFVPFSLAEEWVTVQCIASFIHCITAYYQAPIVFGVQAFMVPAYIFVITTKWVCAINLFLNPLCYMRNLVLFNVLSVYAWVRVFVGTFLKLKIFMSSHYSVAILMAGAVCLPGAGPAVVLFGIIFIFLYILGLRTIYGKDDWHYLHQLSENTHNPFGNSMFKTLFKGAAGGCPFAFGGTSGGDEEAQKEKNVDSYLRPLFHNIDKAGDGVITIKEMKEFALNVKEPKLYSILSQKFADVAKESVVDQQRGITYKDFKELAHGTVYSHSVNGLAGRMIQIEKTSGQKGNEIKARLVFDIFNRNGQDFLTVQELGVVLLEFGLPSSEIRLLFKMFDTNHDGKLEFAEFMKHFAPLWRFAYQEFARTFREEQELQSRLKSVNNQIQLQLLKEDDRYIKEQQELLEAATRRSLRKAGNHTSGKYLQPSDSDREQIQKLEKAAGFGDSQKKMEKQESFDTLGTEQTMREENFPSI